MLAYFMVAHAVRTNRANGKHDAGSGSSLRELVSYCIPIALNDTVGALSRAVDRIVVVLFFSAGHFASYHVGAMEVPVSLLLSAVVSVLIPEISRLSSTGQLDQIGALWKQAVGRLSLITIPLFFLLFTHAGPIITLYAPAEYARAEWVIRIFLLALPLRSAIYNAPRRHGKGLVGFVGRPWRLGV